MAEQSKHVPTYEHKTFITTGPSHAPTNYLNPYNGQLDRFLDARSKAGWELVSYDWGSFQRCVLRRLVYMPK